MVITREIPRPLWRRTLDDLSRLHAGASVQLLVLDEENGLQRHGDGLTLVGLTSDGRAGAESITAIMAGATHIAHIIDAPCTLHVELSWESRTANLLIGGSHGSRTLICLGPPVIADGTGPARRDRFSLEEATSTATPGPRG